MATATTTIDDPMTNSKPDPHPDGNRWQTIGLVGTTILFVVHTEPKFNSEFGKETGRIISARKATPHERKAYEEGNF